MTTDFVISVLDEKLWRLATKPEISNVQKHPLVHLHPGARLYGIRTDDNAESLFPKQ